MTTKFESPSGASGLTTTRTSSELVPVGASPGVTYVPARTDAVTSIVPAQIVVDMEGELVIVASSLNESAIRPSFWTVT